MMDLMNCPDCNGLLSFSGKKWKYSVFSVELHHCNSCNKSIGVYFKDDNLSHMIIFLPSLNCKITKYLKKHEGISLEELAEKLDHDINEVYIALMKMEQKGRAEKI